MKRWTTLALLLAATSATPCAVAAEDSGPLPLGAKAPAATVALKNVDGRELTLADLAGRKGTLVVFTCNHCPWAKLWEQRISTIGNDAAKRGLGVVAINANDPAAFPEDGFDEMVKRAKKLKLAFPYVVDATSDVARAFGATRTPEAFLFDAGGALVYHGTIDDNAREPKSVKEPWLRDAVRAVAEGRTVAVPETKALGCSIKFREPAAD